MSDAIADFWNPFHMGTASGIRFPHSYSQVRTHLVLRLSHGLNSPRGAPSACVNCKHSQARSYLHPYPHSPMCSCDWAPCRGFLLTVPDTKGLDLICLASLHLEYLGE